MISSALVSHREAAKDVVIDETLLPKGTIIHIVPAAIHYNSRIWGPDADKYNPDRWNDLPKSASDTYASGSFLNGPRICIGKSFGLLEYKIYVIQLLKDFEFISNGEALEFQRGGPSLRPQGGLWLKIKPLKKE
jgi:cytochrome P450